MLVFSDFSEKKEKQKQIEYLSYHDQLTGLDNRRFFEEELKRIDTKRNLPLSIVYADVNGLKIINDAFGHKSGDEIIQWVADAFRTGCRADDIIARIRGDEFVLLPVWKNIYFGVGALIAVTIWVVIDLIKNKGKSMPKLVMRETLFIILFTWFIYLVNMGFPILSYFDNSAFIITACIFFLVMIGLFVAPYTNIKKGTPEFQMIIGGILFLLITIVAITILVLT